MTGKFTALLGCQMEACAENVSHRLDDLALWRGKPICQECYEDEVWSVPTPTGWHELPAISLEDLMV